MWWVIWGGLLPVSLIGAGVLLLRFGRMIRADLQFEQAREQFRYQREWLEARFLARFAQDDPVQRALWEDASWHDEALWARDRHTGRLHVLIGVHFARQEAEFSALEFVPQFATVVFEYARGRWRPDGLFLDQVHPHEAFRRARRLEPLVAPPHRVL